MNHFVQLGGAKRIVVKVGTSSLTHSTGRLNLQRIEKLTRVLCDLKNQNRDVILVSSGAITVGVAKAGLSERPKAIPHKQAMAAIGQKELMSLYSKMFAEYGSDVAQILLTRDVLDMPLRRQNAQNTFETLLELGIVPIVNENDTISTDELEFGDNDTLSAVVAKLLSADLLILLTDIDGLYDKEPKANPDAKMIHVVEGITDDVKALAKGAGSNRGTGGMITKLQAGEIANGAGINMVIMNGENPLKLYDLLDGEPTGTLFLAE